MGCYLGTASEIPLSRRSLPVLTRAKTGRKNIAQVWSRPATETRSSANMVYNHTRGAARAREHARLHLSRPLRPLPSLEALQRRCPGVRLSVARVPKTGSTHFLTGLSACKGTAVDLLWDHQAVPPTSCSRASLATLRDPCERFVSSYRHLKRAMKISYANTCALNSHLRTTDSHQT